MARLGPKDRVAARICEQIAEGYTVEHLARAYRVSEERICQLSKFHKGKSEADRLGGCVITADEYAELLRAHTRAIWALKGKTEYPLGEQGDMGRRAQAILQRARAAEAMED